MYKIVIVWLTINPGLMAMDRLVMELLRRTRVVLNFGWRQVPGDGAEKVEVEDA